MKSLFKNFIILIIIFLIISGIFSLFNLQGQETSKIGINKLVQEIKQEQVQEITIEKDKINILLKNGKKQYTFKEQNENFTDILTGYNISSQKIANIDVNVKSSKTTDAILNIILPLIFPILIFIGIFYYLSKKMKGKGMKAFDFGKSKAKKIDKNKKVETNFNDVAGAKEAKEDLEEIVDFLKHPKKYVKLGAKIPKGVLLVGPPGCGKTLLARASAGEAGVPFYHISGSEFIEMFVGVGASRVRDLFEKAKKHLPAIVFIDELDAVGRKRGAGVGGSHDEREQTLNQILVELDGFEPNSGLIVMAATNRPDILDPALLRPGRFDRKVILDLPDINGRKEILKIHAKGKPLASDVNLKRVAERTPGFTGADLENLLNESSILTAKRKKDKITMDEILESIERVILGPERRSHILSDKEKNIIAFHEAGHAIVSFFSAGCDPVQKISIISRGRAAGYTLKMPETEKKLKNKTEFLDKLGALLGGYISEKLTFKDVTTGASDDLRKATKIAKKLVTEYGMSEHLGPRTFGETDDEIFLGEQISHKRNYSEKVAEKIDEEVSEIIKLCYNKAEKILKEHKDKLKEIAETLLKKETLEKEQFEKIIKKDNNSKNSDKK
ncbi:MAG TPA: ATP-dependent zinc metalloprotease FtsH [Patescibacteria group bacterium]|nr:ATP-dependent zinc metalloprotease FtsH [Patescibacteria group bacterium]